MPKRLSPNEHFQLRLVKRFDRKVIKTYGELAQPNEGAAKDHIMDFFDNERSALQAARNYSARGEKRKGPLPGEFLGVVVVKYESDPNKWITIRPGSFFPRAKVSHRPRRVPGTATWLYYVSSDEKAFYVDSKTHEKGDPVV
jgi:hypothetical protein